MAIDLSKMQQITARVDEITTALSDPSIASNIDEYLRLSKELADLTPKAETIRKYEAALAGMEEALEILNGEDDPEMRLMANEEYDEFKAEIEKLEKEIKIILAPRDIRDERSVIMEIRAGAGGEEAALFASTLVKMYTGYAALRGFSVKTVDENKTELGGYKEIVMQIEGYGAYSRLKFESGVHRVQRVPATESGGRIHTSTITVAVIPEVDEDIVIDIPEKDVRIDVMRASGNGGQCVNTTDSAVRLTHYPTGIVIYSQTEKSQLQNKAKAWALLRSKLYDLEMQKRHDEEADLRRSQIGTGDRSEKIRTYNFPQGRVTDHRIKLTLYKIDAIMNGDLDEILDSLTAADQAAKLLKMNSGI